MQCQNNLKQLALGCLQHEQMQKISALRRLGLQWCGDPDRGFGKRQPGGWDFTILPYIEQQALHNLGYGAPEGSAAQQAANQQRIQTPLSVMYCPTRRRMMLYPITSNAMAPWTYCGTVAPVARCDYAACCGDPSLPTAVWYPSSFTPYSAMDYCTTPNYYWGGLNQGYGFDWHLLPRQ